MNRYDPAGRLVESALFDGAGKSTGKTLRKFASSGLLEEEEKRDAAGKTVSKTVFSFETKK